MAARKLVASFFSCRQEYQALQCADVQAAAERCGFAIEVLDAQDNGVAQIHELFRFIHAPPEERPLALVVQTLVPDGLERVARNAADAGIGWVLLNRVPAYLEVLRREHPTLPISCVATDHVEIGRIQGRQFRALLPKGGSLLYVQGPPQTAAARLRLEAAQAGIHGAGIELKVVPAQWTETSAEQAVAAWLRLKTSELFKPDLIGCQNDSLAVGARRALLAHRPDSARALYTGCDGLPEGGQRLVKLGQLAATIVVASCGGPAVELLDSAFGAGRMPPASVVVTPRSFPPVEDLGQGR